MTTDKTPFENGATVRIIPPNTFRDLAKYSSLTVLRTVKDERGWWVAFVEDKPNVLYAAGAFQLEKA